MTQRIDYAKVAPQGESEARRYVLPAWRETDFYDSRERAALEWTEAITRVFDGRVPDAIYERAAQSFTDKELADLTLAIIAINSLNRLAIPFRTPAGSYQPARTSAQQKLVG
ncbi:MAG: carboxymuconolactone decarboxylase family protein [Burkholderiales bacterium]